MNLLGDLQSRIVSRRENKRNWEKYLFHKEEFAIPESESLALVERYLRDEIQPFELECSCKVSGDDVFPERFYVSYQRTIRDRDAKIEEMAGFFENYSKRTGMNLDRDQLRRIIRDLQSVRIKRFGFAVDVREKKEDSRIKWGLLIAADVENLRHFADAYKDNPLYESVKESLTSRKLLCAYDFFPDGRTALKVYPLYVKTDVGHLLEKGLVPDQEFVRKMIAGSGPFHIAYKNTLSDKIYHLRPLNEERFIESLENHSISGVYERIAACPHRYGHQMLVSLSEHEMLSNKIITANFYY